MATITIRNVPEDLHRLLKARAEAEHRSLNSQVISLLIVALSERKSNEAELMAELKAFKKTLPPNLWTDEEIQAFKEEGRM